jgi:rubrerythrin
MKTKDPEKIFINDAILICNQCENDQYYSSKYNPGKEGLNFLGFDGNSNSVDVFICSKCGYIHLFASSLPSEMPVSTLSSETSEESVIPEKDPDKLAGPSECMSCGKLIPEGVDHCPSCGWTYK